MSHKQITHFLKDFLEHGTTQEWADDVGGKVKVGVVREEASEQLLQ